MTCRSSSEPNTLNAVLSNWQAGRHHHRAIGAAVHGQSQHRSRQQRPGHYWLWPTQSGRRPEPARRPTDGRRFFNTDAFVAATVRHARHGGSQHPGRSGDEQRGLFAAEEHHVHRTPQAAIPVGVLQSLQPYELRLSRTDLHGPADRGCCCRRVLHGWDVRDASAPREIRVFCSSR